MKQQGHYMDVKNIAYSADGQVVATGGNDGKLKLWNVKDSFCFVTFAEHTGGITGVKFAEGKKDTPS
jgi:periodic tryptophan protein 2